MILVERFVGAMIRDNRSTAVGTVACVLCMYAKRWRGKKERKEKINLERNGKPGPINRRYEG